MSDYLHIITVQGSRSGLGIRVVGPSTPDTPYGVFIKSVTEGSLADRDGQLQTGDKLLQVGREELTGRTQRQAIDLLKLEAQTDSMTFTIDRSQEAAEEFNTIMAHALNEMSSTSTSSIVGPSSLTGVEELEVGGQGAQREDRPSSPIQTITIIKNTHLGIIPMGGEASPEGPQVSVADITEGGDAHSDGRLQIGDIILSINNHSFHSIDLSKVLQLLTRMKISRRTEEYIVMYQRHSMSADCQIVQDTNPSESAVGSPADTEELSSEGLDLDARRSSRLRSSDSKQKRGKGKKKGMQRKISLDPHCRVKLSKLERALSYLGYTLNEEQRGQLHACLDIDEDGYVTYLEFVNEAKKLFAIQIDERQLSSGLFLLGSKPGEDGDPVQGELESELEPEVFELPGDEEKNIPTDLQQEVAVLHKRLKISEARNAAGQLKQSENEKTIRRLVSELQQQRNRTPAPRHDPDTEQLERKIATMGCEHRKLECKVMRYEVAVEKLLQFCQLTHENLAKAQEKEAFINYPRGKGESARSGNALLGNPRPPPPLANHMKFTNITLAQEAQEIVAAVRKIISHDNVLPKGWDEAFTDDGLKYYINYETQTTTWLHPITKTGHTNFYRDGPANVPFTQPPKL